jgi:hypothetical protein
MRFQRSGHVPLLALLTATMLVVGCAGASPAGPVVEEQLADGRVVRASSATAAVPPSAAVDGLVDTVWGSGGFPPAWIEIDLGRDATVAEIRLLPAQSPTGGTVHRISGRADGETSDVLLDELRLVTRDGIWISTGLDPPRPLRYVRVETVESPSWVGWFEIVVGVPGAQTPSPGRLPEGFHDGSIDEIAVGDRCYANGWASDPDDRSADVTVRILSDGTEVWRGLADDPRPDLPAAGIDDGMAGFYVDLRGLISLNAAHEIRTQAQDAGTGRWVDLAQTPRPITCT